MLYQLFEYIYGLFSVAPAPAPEKVEWSVLHNNPCKPCSECLLETHINWELVSDKPLDEPLDEKVEWSVLHNNPCKPCSECLSESMENKPDWNILLTAR